MGRESEISAGSHPHRSKADVQTRLALSGLLAVCLLLGSTVAAAQESAATGVPPVATPTGPVGVASLVDDRSVLDRLEVRVSGLASPPVGSTYRVWLRSDDRELVDVAGDLVLDERGEAALTWSQPAGEALFITYSEVIVTLESGGGGPGPVTLSGRVDPGALTHFRRLLVRWPDSRYGTASLQGLRQLTTNAEAQAAVLREAAANGDAVAMRRKAEHLVNLVEGSRGASAGDLDGEGRAEDPGDGVGWLPYI